MEHLVIIGAGSFGREVYAWARQAPEFNHRWSIKGFLDDRGDALDARQYAPILGRPTEYLPESGDVFTCAISNPSAKERIVEAIVRRGGTFVSVVHPTVVVGENASLGTGLILCPFAVVSCDARLEDFVSVNVHTVVGHNVTLGRYCHLNVNVSIGGYASLRRHVNVGSNATVLPGATVEEGATVGAGSVVLRHVGRGETVFGVPAKPVAVPKPAHG